MTIDFFDEEEYGKRLIAGGIEPADPASAAEVASKNRRFAQSIEQGPLARHQRGQVCSILSTDAGNGTQPTADRCALAFSHRRILGRGLQPLSTRPGQASQRRAYSTCPEGTHGYSTQ